MRRGLPGATATPLRPMQAAGSPFVSWFQVLPPSVDLKMPPPGPFDGWYVYHGGRRVFQSVAYTTCELVGSITTSTAPMLSFLKRTFVQVFPPSCERYTPRSRFAS